MKIWVVSNLPPPIHGVSVFNTLLLRELDRHGIAFRFFRVGSKDHAARLGFFEPRKMFRDAWTVARFFVESLMARLRSAEPQILYFTPSQSGPCIYRDALISAIGRWHLNRVVGHIHGCGWLALQSLGGIEAAVMERALRKCDAVICLGETFAARMRRATRLHCVAINTGTPPMPDALPKRLPLSGQNISLLFLSNFMASKGLLAAAEATRILRGRGNRVVLNCAGFWREAHFEREFQQRFGPEIEAGTIRVVGPADDARKESLLRESHFLLLPISNPLEGQPLALVEAMSCGVVPLTTNQGGIPDLMRFAWASRLVAPEFDQPEGLVSALESIMAIPGQYEELSRRCLDQQRSSLTFARCAEEIIAVLRGEEPLPRERDDWNREDRDSLQGLCEPVGTEETK